MGNYCDCSQDNSKEYREKQLKFESTPKYQKQSIAFNDPSLDSAKEQAETGGTKLLSVNASQPKNTPYEVRISKVPEVIEASKTLPKNQITKKPTSKYQDSVDSSSSQESAYEK